MPGSLYSFELWDKTGQLVADITGIATGKSFTVRRNRPETVAFTCKLAAAYDLARRLNLSFSQLVGVGQHEIRVKRGNRYLVGARILYVRPELSGDGGSVEVRGWGILELLGHRFIQNAAIPYTADLSQVAWNFINYTQALTNGGLGITQGTLATSRTITDTWQPYASTIKEILIGLSERYNGIDFAFSPDKVFSTYYPGLGTDKTELRFSYPGNIKELKLPFDATELANVVYARGSGNPAPVQTRTDPYSPGVYTRFETIRDFSSVSVATTLDELGDEELRKSANPTAIPEITLDGSMEPYLGAYWIGDRVKFDVATYAGFDALGGQTWRINEIAVRVGDNDEEDITLKVGYS